MDNHKKKSEGLFFKLPSSDQQFVKECVCFFHFRDGKKHPDGSMGTIRISPQELRDIISYGIMYGL
jgi:hypothetical protein